MKKSLILIMLAMAVVCLPAQTVIHVSPSGATSGSGATWAGAVTMEHAVSIASSTDVLWVRYGTHHLTGTLVIPDNVRVYGGFLGTETQISQRNFATNVTIIDANQQFAAVTLGEFSVLSGFTVRGGVANIIGRMDGGGVLMLPGSRLEYCYIENNVAANRGGGVFAQGQVEIFSSVLSGNRAGTDGFAVSGGQVLFHSNTVVGNMLLPCTAFDTVFFDTICTGHTLALSTSIAGTYVWNTGATTSSITTPALTSDSVFWVKITMADLCVAVHSFNIHVLAQTLELTSAAATANQSIALGDSILHIVYSFGGAADSVRITWTGSESANLPPAGVTVSDLSVSPVTISGTPTEAGIYLFTIRTLGAVCDSVELSGSINAGMRGCNLNTPGWVRDTFTDLGTITWGNISNTDIETGTTLIMGSGGRPAQVWSGHVFAAACAKGNATENDIYFDGGVAGNLNADCRQTRSTFDFNRDGRSITGDLFSWCAVMRFGHVLCPDGWRVPTREDFIILHQNLGYAYPLPAEMTTLVANTYIPTSGTNAAPQVGGIWGGARFAGLVRASGNSLTASWSVYWSSTETSAGSAARLRLEAGNMWSRNFSPKAYGLTLRCVRDYMCDIFTLTSEAGTANQSVCNGQTILPITFELIDGTLGVATTTDIRWFSVSGTDTTSVSMPTGLTFDDTTHTISGTPTQAGHFIFEIFTVDHDTACAEATVRGTIDVALLPCPGCNNDPLPFELGIPTFVTDSTWHIGAQVWSDAVRAPGCDKVTFNGGTTDNFRADCRNSAGNSNFDGHYFSWCMVMRFADQLCPYPWRVPTREDFDTLHLNLGYPSVLGINGSVPHNVGTAPNTWTYMANTAADSPNSLWGGSRFTGWPGFIGQQASNYWSSTEAFTQALILMFDITNVWTALLQPKDHGFALRCVRAYECDVLNFTVDSATANQTVGSGQIIAPVTVRFVSGTSGIATTTYIRWTRIDSVDVGVFDTIAIAMPTGLTYNGTTHTLSGSATASGRYIFEIFTTNHDTACNEATIRGTLTVTTVSMIDCNSTTPGWGANLGTITWGNTTNQNIETGITIVTGSGDRSGQIWSGAVFATACAKGNANNDDAFDGGIAGNFNADCRQSLHTFEAGRAAGITGDFFSWCAVMRFAGELCPYPWRVPTTEDFVILHQNLGFTVPTPGNSVAHGNAGDYMPTTGTSSAPQVGGVWGGARFTGWTGDLTNVNSYYWASTDATATTARRLTYNQSVVWPETNRSKDRGYALRCVRDTTLIVLPNNCNLNVPGWGDTLGTITWGNTTNEDIQTGITIIPGTGNRPAQAWSGAVFAENCAKGNATANNEFNGGVAGSFNADCRQSLHTYNNGRAAGITGDFFSWCAVVRFGDVLCPYPWRVPETEDFAILHQNFGFMLPSPGGQTTISGNLHYVPTFGSTSAPQIGGRWNGVRWTGVANGPVAASSRYWSSTEVSATDARGLHLQMGGIFGSGTAVTPQLSIGKNMGHALRCVRDTALPPQLIGEMTVTPSDSICDSFMGNITISPEFSGLGTAPTFQWSIVGDGDISGANSQNLTIPAPDTTTTYRITVTNTVTGLTAYFDQVITVLPTAILTLSSAVGTTNQTVCLGDTLVNIVYTLDHATRTQILWTDAANNPIAQPAGINYDTITHTISGTPSVSGVFNYTISSTDHALVCLPVTASGTITVFAALSPGTIGASQEICSGDTPAEFANVTSATGGNLIGASYQWQMSTDSIAWSNIALATDPTFQAEALTTTTHFRRNHLNTCGDTASNVITVTVHSLPSTPTTDSIIGNSDCTGTNPNGIIFMTAVTGMEYSIDSITWGTNPTFTGVTHGNRRIFIRNANGCISAATVYVPSTSGAPELVGTMSVTPISTICNPFGTGDIVITSEFTNLGANPTFQWAIVTATDTTDIATATDSILTLSGTSIPTVTTRYRITAINNETGCQARYYQTITVVNDAVITHQPVGDTICIGQTSVVLSVTATSSAPAHTYQWQSSADGVTFADISSATSSSHTVSNTTTSNLWYRVMISRPGTVCPPMFSDTVNVVVLAVPTITSVTDSARCGAGTVVLSAITNPAGLEVHWFETETGGLPIDTTISSATWTTPSITTTTTFWAEAHNGFCASVARTAVVANVLPPHVITHSGGDTVQSVCQGDSIATIRFAFSGGATGGTITWTGAASTAPNGITATADSIYGTVSLTATPGVYNFTITSAPTGGICDVVTRTGSITVYLTPAPIVGDTVVCLSFTTQLSSSPAGGTWSSLNTAFATVDSDGLVTGVSVGTATIRYTLATGSCYREHSIAVAAYPTLTLATGNYANQSVCLDSAMVNIEFVLTNATIAHISWLPSIPTGITFDTLTHIISGTPTVSGVFTYTITSTNHSVACTAVTATGTLTVFATASAGTIGSSGGTTLDICYGDTPVEFTNVTSASGGNPSGASYQWQMSTDSIAWNNIALANDPTFQSGALTATTHFRRNRLNACGDTASNVITVNVHALPQTPATDSITPNTDCSDINPNGIIFITAVSGVEYSIDSIAWGTNPTFTGLTQGDHRIFIRNANGCISAATVHVGTADGMPDLDSILVTPSATICNPFGAGSIVIAPAITNLDATATFQWSRILPGDTTVLSETSNTLTLTGVDIPTVTTTYRITVLNPVSNCQAHFDQVITVVDDAIITGQPVGDTICVGQTSVVLSVTATSSTPAHTYQWQSSADGVTFADISLATSSSHTVSSATASNLWYRVMISRPGAICPPMFSDTVHVVVLAVPTIASVTDSARCGAGTVVLSAITNPAGLEVHWFETEISGLPIDTTISSANWTTPSITTTTTFWAEAHNGFCASAARTAVVATVLPPHVITHTGGDTNQSVCQGSAIDPIYFAFSGGATGGTIAWSGASTNAPEGLNATADSIVGTVAFTATPGVYTFTITTAPTGQTCPEITFVGSITVLGLPATPTTDSITGNSDCTGTNPNGIIFMTAVTGMEYSIDSIAWGTNPTFTGITHGEHRIFIRNANGCVSSAAVTVDSVSGAPVLVGTMTVTPSDTICNPFGTGDIVISPTFDSLGATTPTFQWSIVGGADITGANSQNLTLTGVNIPTATTTYRITVTNTETGCYAYFDRTITVINDAVIDIQPVGDTICVGQTAVELYTIVTSSGHTYQWQSSTDGLTFNDIANATSNFYIVDSTVVSNLWYRVVISRPNAVCPPMFSDSVNVVVLAIPTIASVTDSSRCGAGAVVLSATADPSTAHIRWFADAIGGYPLHTGTPNTGITASGATWTTPSISTETSFWVEAGNGFCVSSARTEVIANVLPPHVITHSGGDTVQGVCQGDSIATIRFAFSGGATGGTITWTGAASTAPEGITVTADSIYGTVSLTATPGVYNFTITSAPTGGICDVVTHTGSITVYLTPATIVGDTVVCLSFTTQLSSSPAGGTWTSLNTAFATVDSDGLVTGVSVGTATIRYTLATGSCYREHSIAVAAYPTLTLATGNYANQSVCLDSAMVNIEFVLTNATIAHISWSPSIPTGITFDTLTHIISGTPTVSGVFTYTITSTNHSAACSAATAIGTLTVFATVSAGTIGSSAGTTLDICYGDTPIEFTNVTSASGGNPAGASYQWQMSTDSIAWNNIALATDPTFQSGALITTTHFRRNHLNACGNTASNVITVNVHALPLTPATDSITPNTDCSDINPNGIIFITAVSGVEYSIDSITWGTNPTFTGLTQGDHRIFIRNANGCISAATVHVGTADGMPDLDSILVTPSATICNPFGVGSIVIAPAITNLDATATFQWSRILPGDTTVLSETSNTLTLTGVDIPTVTTTYRITVFNPVSNCQAHFDQVITVVDDAIITGQPVGDTICVGQTSPVLSVTATSSTPAHTYQWQSSADGVTFADISLATSSSHTVSSATASNLWYRVMISRPGAVCPPMFSDTVHVLVLAVPTIASVTDSARCGAGTVVLSATADPSTANIRWFADQTGGDPLTTGTPNTGITASGGTWITPSLATTTSFWVEADNGFCVSAARTEVVANILFPHVITHSGGDTVQGVCQGDSIATIHFAFSGGATGGTIAWTGAASTAPEGITATADSIYGAVSLAAAPGVYNFTITSAPTGGVCDVVTHTGSITVHGTPGTITITSVSECGFTILTASGGTGGTIFWQDTVSMGTDTLRASTLDTVTANGIYFFRARSAEGCWGTPGGHAVTIVPPQILTLTSGTFTASQNIPIGNAIANIVYTFGGATDSVMITWRTSENATAPPAGITVSSLTASPITISGTPTEVGIYIFTITTIGEFCDPVTLTGTINAGMRGCNLDTAGWIRDGFPGLGTITWGSTSNTNIESGVTVVPGSDDRTGQVWSGAVFATACAKGNATSNDEFDGGDSYNFSADCRQSLHTFNNGRAAGITGDFFSWCAVMRFQDTLCPYPWRVPTAADFAILHENLAYDYLPPAGNFGVPMIPGTYFGTGGNATGPQIGGTWRGVRFTGTATAPAGPNSGYWSSTEHTHNAGNVLWLGANNVWPRQSGVNGTKSSGNVLRCVRDTVVPLPIGCNNHTPLFGGGVTGVSAGHLGTVTWGTSTNTNIESGTSTVPGTGGRPAQTWSGAVFAQGCAKGTAVANIADFDGGMYPSFNADCRQSLHSVSNRGASRTGDFFSWCAVMRFADVLCPAPWRVPTTEDFAILHQNLDFALPALGSSTAMVIGTSGTYAPNNTQQGGTVNTTNPASVGGIWGGARLTGSTILLTGSNSSYWSSTETFAMAARHLNFTSTAVWPQTESPKNHGFALRCVRDTVVLIPAGCNGNPLTFTLGTQSFRTTQTWQIGAGEVWQEWSDAVRMSGCAKGSFTGGTLGNSNADCRSASSAANGHLFSWCMVMRFADQLCPDDWRVPTNQDFVNLDLALGGNGQNRAGTVTVNGFTIAQQVAWYLPGDGSAGTPQFGGIWNGSRFTGHSANLTTTGTLYWSSMDINSTHAFAFRLESAAVNPQNSDPKNIGISLRCIRDIPPPSPNFPAGCNNNPLPFDMGTQSFVSAQTWPVGEQEWSDAVRMSGCAKTTFTVSTSTNQNADCRQGNNTTLNGHYFSWCFVQRFADVLCPDDWRVPTTEDFVALHQNLGHAMPATVGGSVTLAANTYIAAAGGTIAAPVRGGTWGGIRWTARTGALTELSSSYWSSSDVNSMNARALTIMGTSVTPQASVAKNIGLVLRCVRDVD